jgi:hypothetical protein
MHSRQFEDFSSLLEQTAIDEGEDGLGTCGPHTDNINIAHIINDQDDDAIKQVIDHLQTDLPGEAKISEIEADTAKRVAKDAC